MKRLTRSFNTIIITFICLLVFTLDTKCQRGPDEIRALNEYLVTLNHVRRAELGALNIDYSKVSGTPYYREDFMEGRIVLKSGKSYNGPMRLNQYSESIEIRSEDSTVFSIRQADEISYIMIGDQKFVYRPDPDDLYHSIPMELLHEGEYSLYHLRSTRFQAAEAARAYQEAQSPRFIRNKDRFFLLHSDGYFEVKSRRSLLKNLGDKQEALKSFIRTENLNVGVPADLVRIMEYYDQLRTRRD